MGDTKENLALQTGNLYLNTNFIQDFSVTEIEVSLSGSKCPGTNMNNVCEKSNKNNKEKLKSFFET